MRFGGHETFPIREGWLHKGLKLLTEQPELLVADDVADWLGVGKNMAKSIRHWLIATGLAVRAANQTRQLTRKILLEPTPLGKLVWDRDPYFTEIGTWWALHINLVHTPEHAATWTWFFSSFNFDRFDRSVCVESLKRHLKLAGSKRMPSDRTLDRDVGCFLSSYARTIPPTNDDPEDGADCPLRELGLLSHFKTSGYYQLHQEQREIPPELMGYALARAFSDARDGQRTTDISLQDAVRRPGSPGRVFALTSETLFEVVSQIEAVSGGDLQIAGLAGERSIRVRQRLPLDWLETYYASVLEGAEYAA